MTGNVRSLSQETTYYASQSTRRVPAAYTRASVMDRILGHVLSVRARVRAAQRRILPNLLCSPRRCVTHSVFASPHRTYVCTQAASLTPQDWGGTSDPFIVVSFGGKSFQTEVVPKVNDAVYGSSFILRLHRTASSYGSSFRNHNLIP